MSIQFGLALVMVTGRPKAALKLSTGEASELRSFSTSRSLPHALVARARLVLWSAEGKSNSEIASRLNWTKATVGKWRQRFVERQLSGFMTNSAPAVPGPSPTKRLRCCSGAP